MNIQEPLREHDRNPEHSFYVRGELANKLLESFPNRLITMDMLEWDIEARQALLNGLMDGDGSLKEEQHAQVFWSKKKERLDMFQLLVTTLGYRTTPDYEKGAMYYNLAKGTTEIATRHRQEKQFYKGKVWCIETNTGAFVVRRNGKLFISGNSGFPKSLNIGKAIDKSAGAKREIIGRKQGDRYKYEFNSDFNEEQEKSRLGSGDAGLLTAPATKEAKQWNGWGTALKPAHESWILVRKPLSEKTVAKNVLKHGTGAINIDGSRIGTSGGSNMSEYEFPKDYQGAVFTNDRADGGGVGYKLAVKKQYRVNNGKLEQYITVNKEETGTNTFRQGKWEWKVVDETTQFREVDGKIQHINPNHRNSDATYELGFQGGKSEGWQDWQPETLGRFPANLILSHSDDCTEDKCANDCPCADLDKQSGISKSIGGTGKIKLDSATNTGGGNNYFNYADSGGASRFFFNVRNDQLQKIEDNINNDCGFRYNPKISTAERNRGLEDIEATVIEGRDPGQDIRNVPHKKRPIKSANNHPTVKTIKLMSYLITLITPPGGVVLDPFAGSGTTLIAAKELGFDGIGIEVSKEYFEIAKKRIGVKE